MSKAKIEYNFKMVEHGYRFYCETCGAEYYVNLDPEFNNEGSEELAALLNRYCGNLHESVELSMLPRRGVFDLTCQLFQCRSCGTLETKERLYFHDDEQGITPPMKCGKCGQITGKVRKLSVVKCPECGATMAYKKIGKGEPKKFKDISYWIQDKKDFPEDVIYIPYWLEDDGKFCLAKNTDIMEDVVQEECVIRKAKVRYLFGEDLLYIAQDMDSDVFCFARGELKWWIRPNENFWDSWDCGPELFYPLLAEEALDIVDKWRKEKIWLQD